MKYVIYNKDSAPLVNPYANGNAWFVHNIRLANDANEEMAYQKKDYHHARIEHNSDTPKK
jgi:hypothetical protein